MSARRRAGAQAAQEAVVAAAETVEAPEVKLALSEPPTGLQGLAWHEETRTLLAILLPGMDPELVEAALQATFEGIESFDYEYEVTPDGWFTSEILWPLEPPLWMTDEAACIARDHQLAIDLASKPL